ncbi:MAG: hypothetical protein IJT21_09920, partial [Synergistaceae bacterium]|nr:hypothetical protein [Synergistaceae bacterium]
HYSACAWNIFIEICGIKFFIDSSYTRRLIKTFACTRHVFMLRLMKAAIAPQTAPSAKRFSPDLYITRMGVI